MEVGLPVGRRSVFSNAVDTRPALISLRFLVLFVSCKLMSSALHGHCCSVSMVAWLVLLLLQLLLIFIIKASELSLRSVQLANGVVAD